jgi:hypothetical protein
VEEKGEGRREKGEGRREKGEGREGGGKEEVPLLAARERWWTSSACKDSIFFSNSRTSACKAPTICSEVVFWIFKTNLKVSAENYYLVAREGCFFFEHGYFLKTLLPSLVKKIQQAFLYRNHEKKKKLRRDKIKKKTLYEIR